MNAIPNCRLALTDPPEAWREWARTITPGQLVECRGKLSREAVNDVTAITVKCIGAITGVIDAEYLRRFPDLVAEVDAYEKRLEDMAEVIAGRATIEEFHVSNGGFTATMGTEMAGVMANSFLALLDEKKALNYVEVWLTTKNQGQTVTCTIRRENGQTPGQRVTELEAKLAATIAERDAFRQQLHGGPTEEAQ